jgi:hypothetical protein
VYHHHALKRRLERLVIALADLAADFDHCLHAYHGRFHTRIQSIRSGLWKHAEMHGRFRISLIRKAPFVKCGL